MAAVWACSSAMGRAAAGSAGRPRAAPGGRGQRRADGAGSERLEPLRRGLIADAGLQGRHQPIRCLRTRDRAAHDECMRPGALPAQGLCGENFRTSFLQMGAALRIINSRPAIQQNDKQETQPLFLGFGILGCSGQS
jgi:hypothetical protein